MLDLDSLAEKRAKVLNEQEDRWRAALWSEPFRQIAENMSDGEVEALLSHCPSLPHFEAVLGFLAEGEKRSRPYATLMGEAERAGLKLADWIRTLRIVK